MLFKNYIKIYLLSFVIISCSKEKGDPDYNGFPEAIGKIIITKCAISGCHNEKSKEAAAGLSLESWEKMFEGGRSGPAVIPYRSDFSTLFFFVNTYPDLGITLVPTMPYGKNKLSPEEVLTLKNWINEGAPDLNGFVKFSDNPDREKFYISHFGCDVVAVVDANSLLPMRYVDIGKTTISEFPYQIKVSPDKKFWYVLFMASNVIQKFRCSDDSFVEELDLGSGSWQSIVITADSRKAFCIDCSSPGKIKYIDVENMNILKTYDSISFNYPHGAAINSSADFLYVGTLQGNYVYKIDITNPFTPIIQEKMLDGSSVPLYSSLIDPSDIAFSPSGNSYYLCCRKTNEIRIMNAANDSLLATIALPGFPEQLRFSATTNYLFVSCREDTLSFPGLKGSIAIIDYQNNTLIKNIHTGYQPHGLAVDDAGKRVCVANMNLDAAGPGPHHTGSCSGRNGYITFIDMNTLELIPGEKKEVSVTPYSMDIR